MKVKKLLAALLAVAMLLGCLPFAASAANNPTVLYVGEKDKTEDNLIPMLDAVGKKGSVRVYAIDTFTASYYTLTFEEKVGYVLTFYNNYSMSEVIDSCGCGLYCDGDLTVRIEGSVNFDANALQYRDAIGWVVDGTLTVEGISSAASVVVSGDKAKDQSDDGSIGIKAQTLKLHNVTVNATGGYAGVVADEALVMASANLYANTAEAMKDGDDPLFSYSVVTDNLIQIGGTIRADGAVDIKAFYFREGFHSFDDNAVVYGKDYVFAESEYSGSWAESFKVFRNPAAIPSCMKVGVGSTVAKINGNELTLNRRGKTTVSLTIQCGSELITMDSRTVECSIRWWQWIPYLLSGAWVDAFI